MGPQIRKYLKRKLLTGLVKDTSYLILNCLPDKPFVQFKYWVQTGRQLNLGNPALFSEKIQWIKLYDRPYLKSQCADKYRVRDYIKSKIGEEYLIPLIMASDKPNDLIKMHDRLPNDFIIKTNHTSGHNIIVKDGLMSFQGREEKFDLKHIVELLDGWLKKKFNKIHREWEYGNIKPMFLVEELIGDGTGNKVLNDYKIHCFHGRPRYIQTIFERYEGVKETWFDVQWNVLDASYFSDEKKIIDKPTKLDEMLEISRTLSENFIYVRVDLYLVGPKIYFGELTFHPYGGFMIFSDLKWDKRLGNEIKLPIGRRLQYST